MRRHCADRRALPDTHRLAMESRQNREAIISSHVESPIFVVGTPRSGTTLTARLLGNIDSMFMPGETHFLEDIYSRRTKLGPPQDAVVANRIGLRLATLYVRYNEHDDQRRVDGLLDGGLVQHVLADCTTYKAVFERFMTAQMTALGKSRWGNHVPRDLFMIATIMTWFPQARIVICARDPRDYLLSYRDNWRNWPGADAQRLRAIYHPLHTSLLWKASMRAALAAMKAWPEQTILNRYEDMVAGPSTQMAKICAFVGERPREGLLDTKFSNSSNPAAAAGGIFRRSVGRWREALPQVDVAIAQGVCRHEMRELDYDLDAVGAQSWPLVKTLVAAPLAAVRAWHSNARVRGPALPYLLRRISAMLQ